MGHGGRLRVTPDLYWASRNRPLHVQHGSSLQLGREHMRERIGARHLRARFRHLLVRADGDDLHQRGVHRRGWRGIVLHERMHGWGDMSFEHEPSNLHRWGQRLHRQHHLDLRQRRVHRRGWGGVVLHERMHGRYDMSVEHEHSDMRRRGQRLHRQHHLDLRQRSVQRGGWHGIVLHQRVHGRGDPVSVEQEPSDMCRGGQWLQCLPHCLDLLGRAGLRALRPGRVPGSKLGRVADAQ